MDRFGFQCDTINLWVHFDVYLVSFKMVIALSKQIITGRTFTLVVYIMRVYSA